MSKTAFLFPGQGAQTVGMCRELISSYPSAKSLFETASAILGYDLCQTCFEGPSDVLDSTEVAQPAIFTASFAALESLRQEQPELESECSAAAGLSLGEYTALAYAGAMTFEEGLRLVQKRGQAMQAAANAVSSAMVSILGLDEEKVDQLRLAVLEEMTTEGLSDEILLPANYLCPGNIVLSGTTMACRRAADKAEEFGAMRAIPLSVAGAFHTPIMKPADETLASVLAEVNMHSPRIPVYSNVDAASHSDPQQIKQILVKQVLSPVRWEQTIRNLLAEGYDNFVEIGPGRVLAGLLKRISRKTPCQNYG